MPSPSSSLATLRPDLAASLEEFDLESNYGGFIGSQVFPVLNVAERSGNFGIIPIEQLLQEADTERAPGTGYARGKWKFETGTYTTAEHGWEEPVDDNEAAAYGNYFRAEVVATARARAHVLINKEKRVAAAVFNATTYASQKTTITNEWDDAAAAIPINDVETAVRAVYNRSGLWPNCLIMNRLVFRNLRLCDQIREELTASGAGQSALQSEIAIQQLQKAFDLPYILVAGGIRNSANEGQAATIAQIWDSEYAMVCRIAMSDDFREPCIGRSFHWGGDGSSPDGTVESYRDEAIRSDIIRCRHQMQEKNIHIAAAQLLDNVTTI